MSTPLRSDRLGLPPLRLDQEPLDPGWRPPAPDRVPWSASLKFLVVVSVLLLVVGGVWTAGGFAAREDTIRSYRAEQVVDAGPLTITLTSIELTWTPRNRYQSDDTDKWAVVARGTATSKLTEPVLLHEAGMLVTESGRRYPADLRFGEEGRLGTSGQLEPGLTGVPVRVSGALPAAWQPKGWLRAGLKQQRYGQQDAEMADSRQRWGNDSRLLVFWCHVTRLPDAK